LRKPDGTYEFTKDGEHYFDDAQSATNPGLVQKVKTVFGYIWKTVTGWFGVNKYVGRGTAGDEEAQAEGQARLDASVAAFKDLRSIGDDPEKQLADAKAVQSLWKGRAKELLGEKYDDFVLSEIKNATGYEAKMISQVLTGDIGGLTKDQIDSVKGSLYTFPAQAVETLAKELRKNDFATGASLYMNAREEGKDPAQVYADLVNGEFPELEYKQLTGVSQLYAEASMMLAYEDAYQRYLLSQQLQ
jgi:hypothetical protein